MATYILTAKHDMNIGNGLRIPSKMSFTVNIDDKFKESQLFTNPQCKTLIGNSISFQSGGIPMSKIPLGTGYWDIKAL